MFSFRYFKLNMYLITFNWHHLTPIPVPSHVILHAVVQGQACKCALIPLHLFLDDRHDDFCLLSRADLNSSAIEPPVTILLLHGSAPVCPPLCVFFFP